MIKKDYQDICLNNFGQVILDFLKKNKFWWEAFFHCCFTSIGCWKLYSYSYLGLSTWYWIGGSPSSPTLREREQRLWWSSRLFPLKEEENHQFLQVLSLSLLPPKGMGTFVNRDSLRAKEWESNSFNTRIPTLEINKEIWKISWQRGYFKKGYQNHSKSFFSKD